MCKDFSNVGKQKNKKDCQKEIHTGVLSNLIPQFLEEWKCEEHNVKIPLCHLNPNF